MGRFVMCFNCNLCCISYKHPELILVHVKTVPHDRDPLTYMFVGAERRLFKIANVEDEIHRFSTAPIPSAPAPSRMCM